MMKGLTRSDICVLGIFVVVLLIWLSAAWLYTYPRTIIKITSFKVLNTPVTAGGTLYYEVKGIKYLPIPGTVYLTLYNATGRVIAVTSTNTDVGPFTETPYVTIPWEVKEDVDYRLGWKVVYHPTILAEKTYYAPKSELFEIRESPERTARIGRQGPAGRTGAEGPTGRTGAIGEKGEKGEGF